MPTMLFDGHSVDISAEGGAKIASLCALTHTPDERREALLDVLFDEGLLCDVCGMAVATQQAQHHGDISLCANCATSEPVPDEEGSLFLGGDTDPAIGKATNPRGALCPYYIVYAGWYGHCPDGKTWEDTDWTYGAWSPQGTDSARAVAKLVEYQQQDYDFCGIEVAFNS